MDTFGDDPVRRETLMLLERCPCIEDRDGPLGCSGEAGSGRAWTAPSRAGGTPKQGAEGTRQGHSWVFSGCPRFLGEIGCGVGREDGEEVLKV